MAKNIQLKSLQDEFWYPVTLIENVTGLQTKLDSLATNEALGILNTTVEGISGKVSALETASATHATKDELSNLSDSLSAYVKTTTLTDTLLNYVHKSELDSYVKSTDLTNTLKDYLKSADAEETYAKLTDIADFISADEIDGKLDALKADILGDDLEETFNTLKAVQDWATEHGTHYADLLATVNGLETTVAGKADSNNVYTKTEADGKFLESEKIGDYYTKSEVDDLIEGVDVSEQLEDYVTKDGLTTELGKYVLKTTYEAKVLELEGTIEELQGNISEMKTKLDKLNVYAQPLS